MKVKISQFRQMVREALMEALEEDHTSHSKESSYSHDVEESISREKRAEHGYTNEDSPEYDDLMEDQQTEAMTGASDPNKPQPGSASSSAALHTRDKSQMQGVGPRPTMATAFQDPGKKQEAMTGATPPTKPQTGSASASASLHTRDKSQMQGVGPRPTMQTAFPKEGLQEKAKLFIKSNKAAYKQKHGQTWKEALMAAAKQHLGQ